jgi:hypothetical protein
MPILRVFRTRPKRAALPTSSSASFFFGGMAAGFRSAMRSGGAAVTDAAPAPARKFNTKDFARQDARWQEN